MMPAALDLELIKTFLTVVEVKSFKPAAEQLHRTPAAVSQQIKRLEEIVGKRLLERNNQGISLTSAGEVLREKGQQLMWLNYELLGDLRENELSGPLKFGAPTDYAPTLLERLIPTFRRDFPRISPKIVLEPSRTLRPRVNAGTLDLAIVAKEPGSEEGHDLWTEEIAWFGTSKELDGTARIGMLTTDCVLRDHALASLKGTVNSGNHVLEAATVASLRDAVEAGYCQALLPATVSAGLKRSPLDGPATRLHLTFCLIAGPRFDVLAARSVAQKFRDVL